MAAANLVARSKSTLALDSWADSAPDAGLPGRVGSGVAILGLFGLGADEDDFLIPSDRSHITTTAMTRNAAAPMTYCRASGRFARLEALRW